MINKIKQYYEEIKTPTLYSIVVTLSCFVSLAPLYEDTGFAWSVILCLLCFASAIKVKKNCEYTFKVADTWWKKLFLAIFFIYFNINLYGIAFLEPYSMDGFKLSRLAYIPIALAWTTPLFFGFIKITGTILNSKIAEGKSLSWRVKIIAFILLMANYSIWLFAFNPCIASYDTADLYNQAHQMITVPMGDGHPPFYTIVMSLLLKIWDSPTFLVVIQCIAFSVLLISILDYLLKNGCKKAIAVILYLVLGFGFNHVMQMVSLWKDIPFMISITWLTFLTAQLVLQKFSVKTTWYVKLVFALVFTSFFRHNGILASYLLALILLVMAIIKKNIRMFVSVVSFAILVVVIKWPVYSLYKVQGDSGFKYSALANDLIGTYYTIDDPSDELAELVQRVEDACGDDFNYYAYYTECNGRGLGEYEVAEFVTLYAKTFIQHPRVVFTHFMRRNSVMWSIVRTEEEVAGCVDLHTDYHSDEFKYSYPRRVENFATKCISEITKRLTESKFLYVFSWRTAIYTLFVLSSFIHCLAKKRFAMLLVYIPVLLNMFTLYVASGWTCYRYYWPNAVMALIILPFVNLIYKKHSSVQNTDEIQD